jgi:hypothetical protein
MSIAISQLKKLIEYDLQSELPFDAYEKFDVLQQETCDQSELCDSIVRHLIDELEKTRYKREIIYY